MTKDKKRLYIASLMAVAVLLVAVCVAGSLSRYVGMGLIMILVPICFILIPKRTSLSIHSKEILLLTTVMGVLFVVITQLSGMSFEFYKNPYFVNSKILVTTVIPVVVIIIGSELIRSVLVMQKNTVATIAAFVICVAAELLMFGDVSAINSLNRLMDLVAMNILPAITGGILYHYVVRHYGALPNISYRLLTTLYVYFIPMISGISNAMLSCIKILLPLGILIFVSAMYDKKQSKAAPKNGGALSHVATVLLLIFTIGVAMLISCQFRFGALVIATESMTGEINKGDMIIYEQYDDQSIKEGQVVVFTSDKKNKIVHRVVKIENIGGETRYYTKGDANDTLDSGYRTEEDIVGLTDIKVPYIGYPSLWLREIISN